MPCGRRFPFRQSGSISKFCRRWKIAELRVFGSALREDFRRDSDLDLLVTFAPDADPSLLDHVAMEEELSGIQMKKPPPDGRAGQAGPRTSERPHITAQPPNSPHALFPLAAPGQPASFPPAPS